MGRQNKYVIVSFSPLPEALLRAIFSPYAGEVGREIEFIVINDISDKDKVLEALRLHIQDTNNTGDVRGHGSCEARSPAQHRL